MGIALIFVLLGLEKALNFDETRDLIHQKNLPLAGILVIFSVAIELLGGLLLVIGFLTRPVSLIMAAYLIPTTLIFYPIWQDVNHMEDLLKNLAIIGGLLTLAYHGAGPKSIDSVHLW